jgi:hypothetical protein
MVKHPEKHSLPSNSSIATTSTMTSSNSERTPNLSYASRASPASHIPNTLPAVERHFQAIEHRLDASVTRMDSIETLCRQLKSNTDIISQQLHQLASDFSTANGVSAQCRSPASKSQRLSGGYKPPIKHPSRSQPIRNDPSTPPDHHSPLSPPYQQMIDLTSGTSPHFSFYRPYLITNPHQIPLTLHLYPTTYPIIAYSYPPPLLRLPDPPRTLQFCLLFAILETYYLIMHSRTTK